MTDVPDWTQPLAIITGAMATSDLPDWAIGVAAAPGTTTSFGGGFGVYGDGSDGSPTFDGTTTILTIAPSSSTYTLKRDLFLASPTVNSGVTIITAGFRIFCSGTFTNNGTIKWNGNSPTFGTGATALSNSGGSISNTTVGTAGGSGGVGSGGGPGAATSSTALGGAGGAGGSGTSGAGGAGGTLTAYASNFAQPRTLPWAVIGQVTAGQVQNWANSAGGAGGGAGGGSAGAGGGGGGGGGGVVIVAAKAFAGTGAIQARGANGGNNQGFANTGGGGGGGGGLVVVVSGSVVSNAIPGQTVDAAGGSGVAGGTGGGAGSNGSAGTVVLLPN